MIIHPEVQGSVDWMIRRSGIPTASEFGNLVTDKFEVRTGETPKSYVAKKLAEAWLGGPLAEFNSFDMEQGTILEGEAIPWFEFEYGAKVERVGLITTDDGKVGCSPDGLLHEAGLEIKCPRIETQIKYLLKGVLPPEYGPQVYGSLLVTGRPMWTFVSYSRRLPKLVLSVERDEAPIAAIQDALDWFRDAFDKGWARLCELNDGPPKRRSELRVPKPNGEMSLTYLQ